MTVTELYEQNIKSLPPSDRLRLAKLILDEIVPDMLVNYSDHWSEEDLAEFSQSAWQRAEEQPDGNS